MRNTTVDRWLSGALLVAAVAAPTTGLASSDRVEQMQPPPQHYNGGATRAGEPLPPTLAEPSNDTSLVAPDKTFSAIDVQISDRLRDIASAKPLERRIPSANDRKAIETYYAAYGFSPIWVRDGRPTPNALIAVTRLKHAEADALDPADYPVPDFAGLSSGDALAEADLRLTASVMTYARHLAVGRIAPTRVSAEVDYGNRTPDAADVIRKIAEARDLDSVLDGFNPPQDGFRALKDKLAELRRDAGQAEARSPGDAAISGPGRRQQIDRVMANMERWRWLPRDLGRTYVMVNIPDYTLKVVRDRGIVWRTKIVAGKPQTPTPLLSAQMDNVLVNPSWHVPQSIIQNELLPRYGSDPNIFDRMGLEVRRGSDGNINVVQPPGAANALGRIKFNFPNKFQVYLHDTPEKRLFAADKRAFSHGCMRVENPTKFGEVVLAMSNPAPTPNSRQLDALFGKEEKTFKMVSGPMVHVTYQTAFVEDGRLVLRDDIYGFDARISAIMHSDERRIADGPPPQDLKREAATARANQDILRRVERREAQHPFMFFEQLFR